MQEVKLNTPRVINGAVRYPVEGLIPVSDAEYDRLVKAKALDLEDDDEADEDGLDVMTIADLKALAESEEVDIGTATRKADIVAAIRANRIPAA